MTNDLETRSVERILDISKNDKSEIKEFCDFLEHNTGMEGYFHALGSLIDLGYKQFKVVANPNGNKFYFYQDEKYCEMKIDTTVGDDQFLEN